MGARDADAAVLRAAAFPDDAPIVRELFREYGASLPFSLCFQGFEEELATLPGRYAQAEGGAVLLAEHGGHVAGCVALRRHSERSCEMKRLWVRPMARGRGLGRVLAAGIVRSAREMGYAEMVLDTESGMREAIALYRSMGFVEGPPYGGPSPLPGILYFRLSLAPSRTAGSSSQ